MYIYESCKYRIYRAGFKLTYINQIDDVLKKLDKCTRKSKWTKSNYFIFIIFYKCDIDLSEFTRLPVTLGQL